MEATPPDVSLVRRYRAQTCVREILDSAFPYLAAGGTESAAHMRDVGRLMASLGHDDWAEDVRAKFEFGPMRRRPTRRFSHEIQPQARGWTGRC